MNPKILSGKKGSAIGNSKVEAVLESGFGIHYTVKHIYDR